MENKKFDEENDMFLESLVVKGIGKNSKTYVKRNKIGNIC